MDNTDTPDGPCGPRQSSNSQPERFHAVQWALFRSIPKGSHVLLACSGGIDSAVMLRALTSLIRPLNLELGVAHVDHGFRPDSWQDASFVAAQAMSHGLSFFATRLPSLPPGVNLEAWGREQRYRYLTHVRRAHRFDWLCTAHTADDLVETLLMRLISGREVNLIEERNAEWGVLRPLLSVFRSDIEEFARLQQVAFREDSTNRDVTFFRNRVRAELLPFLEQFSEGRIREVLTRQALRFTEDGEALDMLAKARAAPWRGKELLLREDLRDLRSVLGVLPAALRWRVVEDIVAPIAGFAVGRRAALRALAVIEGQTVRCELPGKVIVVRSGGVVKIERHETVSSK